MNDSKSSDYFNLGGVNAGDTVLLKDGRWGIAQAFGKQGEITLRLGNDIFSCFYPEDVERVILSKYVRIYQLSANSEFVFMGYDFCKERGLRHPPAEMYEVVFDGSFGTDSLEKIYEICNLNHPQGYSGRSLSVSDVVELYDAYENRFYYCDTIGFKEIPFEPVIAPAKKLTIWTYFSEALSFGNAKKPVGCVVEVIERLFLGYGYFGYRVSTPFGSEVICEEHSGAIVGSSLDMVRRDISTGVAETMKQQVSNACKERERVTIIEPEEFWRVYEKTASKPN